MEPTLTQNCALYYAQHKTSKGRAALFKKFRAAARKQGPDVRQQLTFGDLFIVPRLHKDNGSLSRFIDCDHGSPDFRKFTKGRKRFCRRATLGKRRGKSGATSTVTL